MTTRMPLGGCPGQGVNPSVSTTVIDGRGRRAAAALMPAPIHYSHKVLQLLSEARRSGVEKALGPDAKSQVTVRYENGVPVGAFAIVTDDKAAEFGLGRRVELPTV